jgi:hypothetical protein
MGSSDAETNCDEITCGCTHHLLPCAVASSSMAHSTQTVTIPPGHAGAWEARARKPGPLPLWPHRGPDGDTAVPLRSTPSPCGPQRQDASGTGICVVIARTRSSQARSKHPPHQSTSPPLVVWRPRPRARPSQNDSATGRRLPGRQHTRLQPSSLRPGLRRVSTSSCGVLALLSCRLLRILLLTISLSLLPQQAACCASASGNSSPAGARRFPQPVWTTRGGVRLRGDSRRSVPRQGRKAALRWRCVVSFSQSAVAGVPWLPHELSERYACLRGYRLCVTAALRPRRAGVPRRLCRAARPRLPAPCGGDTRARTAEAPVTPPVAPQGARKGGTGSAALRPCRHHPARGWWSPEHTMAYAPPR